MMQFVFLCKPLHSGRPAETPSHAIEVLDAGWFPEDDLPDDIDPGHVRRIPEAFRVWRGDALPHFDR